MAFKFGLKALSRNMHQSNIIECQILVGVFKIPLPPPNQLLLPIKTGEKPVMRLKQWCLKLSQCQHT